MSVELTVIKSSAVSSSFWQTLTSAMPTWFQDGGSIMWLLLTISFLVSIVTLERAFIWVSYKLKKERYLTNDCFANLNKSDKEQALISCLALDTPALNMLKHGIQTLPFSPQEKMRSYANEQVNLMSSGQSLLRAAVPIALLLGVLGTLLNLIEAFNSLSLQPSSTTGELFGALSNAFICSAFAVCVALLSFTPLRIFQAQIDKLRAHLQTMQSEFNYICQQKTLVTNNISAIMSQQDKREDNLVDSTKTVAEQSEMPYHYEFEEGSGDVSVNLHKEMEGLQKPSASSLIDMYKDELETSSKAKKRGKDGAPSLLDIYDDAVSEDQELYGVNEVELQEQQENAHLKKADHPR